MKKRKSTRETENMIQTALWLPRDVHEVLKEAGGERGLGDEIRRRLQVSFDLEQRAHDERTDALLNLISRLAQKLALDEPWWETRLAFDAFKAAICNLMSDLTSIDQPTETTGKLRNRYGSDEPEVIAQKLLRGILVEHATEVLRKG